MGDLSLPFPSESTPMSVGHLFSLFITPRPIPVDSMSTRSHDIKQTAHRADVFFHNSIRTKSQLS